MLFRSRTSPYHAELALTRASCHNDAEFKPLFMVHNFLLSAGSGLVLALMLEEVSRVAFFRGRRSLAGHGAGGRHTRQTS